jgi:hypothetical protein
MIPEHEWLPIAKRLAIGMRQRVWHGQERRQNMIVANAPDRWWAYCQACKQGGVVRKDHVIITGAAPATSTHLTMPTDLRLLAGSDAEAMVLGFLARKNMDCMYLPPLWWSDSRKRVLLDTGYGWMGRDVTEKSMQKWLTYNATKFLGRVPAGSPAVVVEDTFSWYKVQWAMRGTVPVLCALGTGIKDSLVLELMEASKVIWFFDGDPAGTTGADAGAFRMRGLGIPSIASTAPAGMDPKDMHCDDIVSHIGGLL